MDLEYIIAIVVVAVLIGLCVYFKKTGLASKLIEGLLELLSRKK